MSINMLIGIKRADGSIKNIYSRVDGGEDQDKLFYKYYRTPERVNALINNGSGNSAVGIHISKRELVPNSELANKEVTMLPIGIGSKGDNPLVSFNEKEFYAQTSNHSEEIYINVNEEDYFKEAKEIGFYDDDIYLFDPSTNEWTCGAKKTPLRDAIISNFDKNAPYNYDSDEEILENRNILIQNMDEIDKFIKERESQKALFVDATTSELIDIDDPLFLMKFNELKALASRIGLDLEGCVLKKSEKKEYEEEHVGFHK